MDLLRVLYVLLSTAIAGYNSESTNSSYSFCEEIVHNHFSMPDNKAHILVKDINQILKELGKRKIYKPDLQLELTITELKEKFGQNDLTIELIRNALGLDTLG